MLCKMNKITRYKIRTTLRFLFFIIFPLITLIALFFLSYIWRDDYIDKRVIQNNMSRVIRNGGTLDEIRHIYDTKNSKKMPVMGLFNDFLDNNYDQNVTLSTILSDLLVKYYSNDTIPCDTVYLDRLQRVVTEYNAIHPFDGLEEGQKYYLENIRQKLDSNYVFIQEDLMKVGDELDRKNLLVNKYLNKSEISFWISIVALIITIILSSWQLRQNYNTKKQLDSLVPKQKIENKDGSKLEDNSDIDSSE